MSFGTPLGLLALLGIPAVLALHLYRRRLAQRRVAGLFLWRSTAPRAEAGRRRTRLQQHASLWLELLAVALLALWLSGLRIGMAAAAPHLVIVLDDTGSMSAAGIDGRSAADSARTVAARLAAELPRDGVATLVRSGARPEVLCGPRAPATAVPASLATWRPSASGHDLAPALDLAVELGGTDAELVLLTDAMPARVPPGCRVEAFGVAAPNAALLSARRITAADGAHTVFCDVAAFGRPLNGEVVVESGGGTRVAAVATTFETGRSRHLAIPVPADDAVLVARVVADDDAMELDDSCPLPPPPDRSVTFASALDGSVTARLELRRAVQALDGVVLIDDPTAAHVRFAAAPGALRPGHHEVVVGARDGEHDSWIGPFLVDRRSPLVQGLTLDGVVWTAGRGALPGDVLVLADAQPLVTAERVEGDGLRLHLEIDLQRSNLTSSPDWPILLANVAEHARVRLPGVVEVVVPIGGVVRFRGPTDGLVLVGPDGSVRPARGVGLATWEATAVGIHRLERAGIVEAAVGVPFVDPRESDLTGRGAFRIDGEALVVAGAVRREAGAPGRREARAIVLLLLAVMFADWWVLRARGGAA